MHQGPNSDLKCPPPIRFGYLERTLLLVLFNVNKRVDDPVDDLLVGVLATTITEGEEKVVFFKCRNVKSDWFGEPSGTYFLISFSSIRMSTACRGSIMSFLHVSKANCKNRQLRLTSVVCVFLMHVKGCKKNEKCPPWNTTTTTTINNNNNMIVIEETLQRQLGLSTLKTRLL